MTIFDCSQHAKNKIHLQEVEAADEEQAIYKAFVEISLSEDWGLSYLSFKKKIGKRFSVNTILI